MAKRDTPNYARRLRLATELRRLRTAEAKLTGQQVRDRLGWRSSSKLSRIENGESGVKRQDLKDLLGLYGVTSHRSAELFALAEESRLAGPALATDAHELDSQRRLLDAERDASSIWIWEPQIVPGLFQIPAYSRALLRQWDTMFALPTTGTERRIQARLLRQDVLSRSDPIHLQAVIDESVLHRRFGDGSVMREQMARLLAIGDLPQIEIRIVPLAGHHVIGTGAFNYFRFRQIHDVPLHDLVAFEHLTGTSYLDKEEETHRYAVAFENLRSTALSPSESRSLIARNAMGADLWEKLPR